MKLRYKPITYTMALVLTCRFGMSALGLAANTDNLSHDHIISGVVVNEASGLPISGTIVSLADDTNTTQSIETVTDVEGRFSFTHLPNGRFLLQAMHPSYLTSAFEEHEGFSTAIVIGDGLNTVGIRFALKPSAVISGTVEDDSGDPVQLARIFLYCQSRMSGTVQIVRVGETNSDPSGSYEFARLEPGKYYIAVTGKPWYARPSNGLFQSQGLDSASTPPSPLDVVYPTTYYPDVTDPTFAMPIPVNAGEHAQIKFTLHPVQAAHAVMHISSQHGSLIVPMLEQKIFGVSQPTGTSRISYESRGVGDDARGIMIVQFSGIAPGHYDVDMRGENGELNQKLGIDTEDDPEVIDAAADKTSVNILGSVRMTDGQRLPSGLRISLQPQEDEIGVTMPVNEDGRLQPHGVNPGLYKVVISTNAAVAVEQMRALGATLDGDLLRIKDKPVYLAATLVAGTTTVTGVVRMDGRPASGIMTLLAPDEPRAADRDLFRRDQSASDGSFILKNVVCGNYTILAIKDGWTLDWMRLNEINSYIAKGVKIKVPEHKKIIQISSSVDVQTRQN